MMNSQQAKKAINGTLPMEKDETELQLEKILFGDEDGFLRGLQDNSVEKQLVVDGENGQSGDDESVSDAVDLEGVPDEQLFFIDTDKAKPSRTDHQDATDPLEGDDRDNNTAAWIDSDDDRLHVSLTSHTRLRKLRNYEGEDVIDGREYIMRLRRQYQRLHPTPSWASTPPAKNGSARRRRSRASRSFDQSDSDSSDLSTDDETISPHPPTQALSELLRIAGSLTRPLTSTDKQSASQRSKLRPDVLDIQRSKDIVSKGPSSVDCLQFHPYYPLILSSGPSSTVFVHHVSPHPPNSNPLLTSLHIKNNPLHSTVFLPQPTDSPETTICLSSRRRYIHTWSLSSGRINKIARPFTSTPHLRLTQRSTESLLPSPCGRYLGIIGSSRKGGGFINVFSSNTHQWLCACRVDSRGGVADFVWWRDGEGFSVVGKNGECSEYDVREKAVVGRWIDEGAVGTTVIALGGRTRNEDQRLGGDRYVAVGSSSGIVNIYDRKEWSTPQSDTQQHSIPARPSPLHTFKHLTTPTSILSFSPDGQVLALASRWKRDALRLVHLPSCTVYRNWPTEKTPLGRISSLAWSAGAGLGPEGEGRLLWLAVGNEQGAVRLWEIRG